MASESTAPNVPDSLLCQTPDCPNPIAVVVTRLDDHEADALCQSCNMIFWLAVLQQAAEAGLIAPLAQTAPTP